MPIAYTLIPALLLLGGCAWTDGARVADGGANYERTCTDAEGFVTETRIVSGREVDGGQLAVSDPCGGVVASAGKLSDHDLLGPAIEAAADAITGVVGRQEDPEQ